VVSAWSHGVQADNYMNQAQFLHDQRKANNPFQAGAWGFLRGFIGAGGMSGGGGGGGGGGSGNTLMTSSGTVSDRWYGTNQSAGSGSYSTWG